MTTQYVTTSLENQYVQSTHEVDDSKILMQTQSEQWLTQGNPRLQHKIKSKFKSTK